MEGQQKLKAAKVLCVGTGGLGAPLALYLAAAGVGTIGLVDFDVVDESNLQRQIIHSQSTVGKLKVDSAEQMLKGLNKNINIVKHNTMLTSANALEIFKDYDVIADGTDNFQTRYLVNDACVLTGKPNAYGSIFRFEGQASVFATEEGPATAASTPSRHLRASSPRCAEGGVLGILPGLVGVIQATEVIKLILGIGQPLIGRLLLVDALGMNFRTLKLRKNPDCPACGTHEIKELIDYDQFCGIEKPKTRPARSKSPRTKPSVKLPIVDGIPQITVEDLKRKQRRAARTSSSSTSASRTSTHRQPRRAADPGRVHRSSASVRSPTIRTTRSSSTAAPARAARRRPSPSRLQASPTSPTSPAAFSPGPTRSTQRCRSTKTQSQGRQRGSGNEPYVTERLISDFHVHLDQYRLAVLHRRGTDTANGGDNLLVLYQIAALENPMCDGTLSIDPQVQLSLDSMRLSPAYRRCDRVAAVTSATRLGC